MKIRPVTEAEVRGIFECLSYDPLTGDFFRLIDRRGALANYGRKIPARPSSNGYIQIRVDGRTYQAQRLGWLLTHGEWPELVVDHIDQNKSNNKLENLRTISFTENMRNRSLRTDNKSGVNGVFKTKSGKWQAYYYRDGIKYEIGNFDEKEQAITARQDANERAGFHENHGKEKFLEHA